MLIQKNIPLKKFSNFKIGGNASFFAEFKTKEALMSILLEWRAKFPKMNNIFVLGEGTNILFNDKGFDGLIIKNNIEFIKKEDSFIEVGAGTSFSKLVDFYISKSYTGLEWAGGLPGSVGGAIRGNAGAFGGETKDLVEKVTSMNLKTIKIVTRENKDCLFDYRNSIYKSGAGKDEIILSAKFKFNLGKSDDIRKLTQEKIDHRIRRHPLNYPNLGSIFKNTPIEKAPGLTQKKFEKSIKSDPFPVIPTAKLIVDAGLVGVSVGDAKISEKHPNYIVNVGTAKESDVINLINLIKRKIKENYGIELAEEITTVPPALAK